MSPLQNLLGVFTSQESVHWPAFDNVPGVKWRDPKPLDNPDARDASASHDRSGTLLLSGFGEVEVPDGNTGADAGTKKDNEGHVGVTLNGDVETVQSIALLKFYPSEHYQDIIQRQLSSEAKVAPITSACALDYGTTAENTQKNAFYEIHLSATAPTIYAEAYVDDEGGNQGPGTTTFVFYRSKPTQRMTAMRCKES
ncbi:hypothetical protein [Rhodanobacter sp. L36]|uniref:hypothetical protein n=1 Tax=Rhodanobacter sp. L36 TaxID=1747221 RepID=UPI00131A9992|nr:hypothetical protein [Rhodanobacter sp. L36]